MGYLSLILKLLIQPENGLANRRTGVRLSTTPNVSEKGLMLDEETGSADGGAILSAKIGIGRPPKGVNSSVIGELFKFKINVPRITLSGSPEGILPAVKVVPLPVFQPFPAGHLRLHCCLSTRVQQCPHHYLLI